MYDDNLGLNIALENARKSYDEGGIPIGAALLYHGNDVKYPRILGAGHNQRVQRSSAILHGEMAALESSGRLDPEVYRSSTMVCKSPRTGIGCLLVGTLLWISQLGRDVDGWSSLDRLAI